MGAHASMHAMDTKSLAKAAEEAGVPVALRTKITENGIDGSMVLEYARLPEDELAQISKELFPDSLVDRIKLKGVLRKVNASSSASASSDGTGGGGGGISVPVDLRFRSSRLTLGNVLGKGSFATVYRATYSLDDGQTVDVAFKRIDPEHLTDARDVAAVERELQLMHAVTLHANVTVLLGVNPDARAADARGAPCGVGLMMELAEKSLFDLLQRDARPSWPSWPTRATLLLDIARGMETLAAHLPKAIIHRDLKSANVRPGRAPLFSLSRSRRCSP